MGVPQYRFRETFQSRAFAIQFPKRPSPTLCGTLWRYALALVQAILSRYHCIPSSFLVVGHNLVNNGLYSDEPRRYCTINQWGPRSNTHFHQWKDHLWQLVATYLQQKGYEWLIVDCTINRPFAFSTFWMSLSAAFTYWPAKSGTSAVNMPLSSSGLGGDSSGRRTPLASALRWSSSPKAGAWCTIPVPSASVT